MMGTWLQLNVIIEIQQTSAILGQFGLTFDNWYAVDLNQAQTLHLLPPWRVSFLSKTTCRSRRSLLRVQSRLCGNHGILWPVFSFWSFSIIHPCRVQTFFPSTNFSSIVSLESFLVWVHIPVGAGVFLLLIFAAFTKIVKLFNQSFLSCAFLE